MDDLQENVGLIVGFPTTGCRNGRSYPARADQLQPALINPTRLRLTHAHTQGGEISPLGANTVQVAMRGKCGPHQQKCVAFSKDADPIEGRTVSPFLVQFRTRTVPDEKNILRHSRHAIASRMGAQGGGLPVCTDSLSRSWEPTLPTKERDAPVPLLHPIPIPSSTPDALQETTS